MRLGQEIHAPQGHARTPVKSEDIVNGGQPDKSTLNRCYESIYLSPHLDDVVLSCGGRVYQEGLAGRSVLVVTLMAGDPPAPAMRSPFVAALHSRWGLENTPKPVAVRRAEDLEALSLLGAEAQHAPWLDCIYRQHPSTGEWLYHSEDALWGPAHPVEGELVAQMARYLADLPLAPAGRVYVPLAVGGHVDHRLVRQAAEVWDVSRERLVYYADYPYAEQPDALSAVLGEGRGWRSERVPLTAEDLAVKAEAVARYRSQVSTFFPQEIGPRLRAWAQAAGEREGWAERYWRYLVGAS